MCSSDLNVNEHSTLGASYASRIINFKKYRKSIDFQLWDTAGQERFRGIANLLYKEAQMIILVYDITNHESFTEIKDYWYNQAKEKAPKNISN